ncbi:MAG: ATP-grasp domain-containing protein [Bacteroidales bacterium]|nr:ATP-grasp domain-containing protein [Bacteroidales bacterium]
MEKVVILINALGANATPDELDVLNQARAVEEALHELGYESQRIFMDLNLQLVSEEFNKIQPKFVFNLVESLDNSGKLICLAPILLEHLRIPFTGCSSQAMYVSSNKTLTKSLLRQAKLPTPQWFEQINKKYLKKETKYIAKPVWEDASVGIDDTNVMPGDIALISNFISRNNKYRYFFEEYIEGREFNISILGGDKGPEVLPAAEILFRNYPKAKARIIGYEAKWLEGSFEYENTVRTFGLEKTDPKLADRLKQLCLESWSLFGLTGYSRIDFRVDKSGKPWILEVNANPCLSADAGFYAAATQAGYSFTEVVKRICEDVWKA